VENFQGVSSAQWSQDSSFLVTGGEDYTVRIWSIKSGTPLVKVLKGHGGPVSSVALSWNDQLIASGGDETKVILYDTLETGFHLTN
jgi:WD40 repeat protein